MSMDLKNCFREIVENIFNRWTALKLAVEHGMAKNGIQVYKHNFQAHVELITQN